MRKAGEHGGWGKEAALLCSFLRASGARIGEIPRTTWRCVNWKKDELYLPGYKTAAAPRDIPLFAELKVVLREIQEWRKVTAIYREDKRALLEPNDRIFKISECQKTIDAACAETGVTRITHHDFRHIFATSCLEAGVDVRTIASWLGHADGGVLVLRTYGHLRSEHSHLSAKKVTFGALPMIRSA
jgi:integrase